MIRTARPPYLVRKYYADLVWRIETKEKKLFLTFDDGPIPEATPFVLDTLASFNAKATFFCLGKNAEKHPVLTDRILNEGHIIGNHTYSHLNGWRVKDAEYETDIERCEKVFNSGLFRPPYGRIRQSQISWLKNRYSIVMWDVLTWDFDTSRSPEDCLRSACSESREGSILVFHDSIKALRSMQYALPKLLRFFTGKGYTFEAIRTLPQTPAQALP